MSQTYKYWPKGTVFVSVVDPGVGSSLMNLSLALNEDDFAKRFKVQSGPDWLIVITP